MRVYLCEKPSQANDIARVLGADERAQGYRRGRDIAVTWCVGHLLEAAPPQSYEKRYKWWSLDDLPIVPQFWLVEIKVATRTQLRTIKRLLDDATEVIIATDADREGEMIAREVLDWCRYRGRTRRLWLSALNDASIRQALNALKPADETLPLYHAALARSRADWLAGMNLSRLFTLLGRKAGYDQVLSVGRVQTPTLRLVVDRDREIERFMAVPYWVINVALTSGAESFVAAWMPPKEAVDNAGRCIQPMVAQSAAMRLRAASEAKVVSVETERVREPPPLPFDLSTLQETCSRRLGLAVQETLNIAQSLYEKHKATTYPRSDSRHLPESMLAEVPTVLDALIATDPTLREFIDTHIDRTIRSRVWNDHLVTAHHAIVPTLEPTRLSAMSDNERAVYRLIRSHYLAQFMPAHEFDRTTAALSCRGESLRATGKRIVVPGWHLVLSQEPSGDTDDPRSQRLPPLARGQSCGIDRVELKALKTSPPKPYTQGELIKAMKGVAKLVTDPELKRKLKETTGIGTEATRAGIIENLLSRGYVVKQGRTLRATDTAFLLIDAVPPAITDPGTTALWEQALDLIASGQLTVDTFVEQQATWIRELVEQYRGATLAVRSASSTSAQHATPSATACMSPAVGHEGD
jgi:DNA topoisomerase-3